MGALGLPDAVEKNIIPEPNSGCWLWMASVRDKAKGYGQIRRDGHTYQTHRFIWQKFFGAIPRGLCVCHACDNPYCVNPGHLFLGTNQDNVDDAVRKGRTRKNPPRLDKCFLNITPPKNYHGVLARIRSSKLKVG